MKNNNKAATSSLNGRNILLIMPLPYLPSYTGLDPAILAVNGWRIHTARSPEEAQEISDHYEIRVAMVALEPERLEEMEIFLDQLSAQCPLTYYIGLLFPTHLNHLTVRLFISQRCVDYHTLPINATRLSIILGHVYGMAALTASTASSEEGYDSWANSNELPGGSNEIMGIAPAMRRLRQDIHKIALADAPVLINGETGVGKELVARTIHRRSRRAARPFFTVNCAALPGNLIQSELFGQERGAFAGMYQHKVGQIEAAEGGTILLDEIGDLAYEHQVNLLRFLQRSAIQRVGGVQDISLNVRVIAASHVNLENAVAEGLFRADLYYRLNVLYLEIPPLRERESDILLLARFFLKRYAADGRNGIVGFSNSAVRAIEHYPWPGNVRELMNRVQRGVVMSEGPSVTPASLDLEGFDQKAPVTTLDDTREAAERKAIRRVLWLKKGSISQAARALGVSQRQLYRLLEKHNMQQTIGNKCLSAFKKFDG